MVVFSIGLHPAFCLLPGTYHKVTWCTDDTPSLMISETTGQYNGHSLVNDITWSLLMTFPIHPVHLQYPCISVHVNLFPYLCLCDRSPISVFVRGSHPTPPHPPPPSPPSISPTTGDVERRREGEMEGGREGERRPHLTCTPVGDPPPLSPYVCRQRGQYRQSS